MNLLIQFQEKTWPIEHMKFKKIRGGKKTKNIDKNIAKYKKLQQIATTSSKPKQTAANIGK